MRKLLSSPAFTSVPMLAALAALATLPTAASAEDTTVAGVVANVRATENDGFGELKWGSDLKALYARYPALKKTYPPGKVGGVLKSGKVAILETNLTFKGVPYSGKLFVDSDGLYRATIEVKIVEEPGSAVTMEKALDPILGDLSAPDDDSPESRVWKGSSTVVAVTRTRQVGSFRLDISFHSKAKYRPGDGGASLGIE